MQVLVVTLLGLVVSSFAEARVEREPLFLRSQTIAQFFRTAPLPTHFQALRSGELEVQGGRTMANYWGRDKRFIVDGQTIDDVLQVRFGVASDLNAVLQASSRKFSDIRMDEITVGFHNLFMIPQDKRLTVDRNKTRVVAPDYGLEITEQDLYRPLSQPIGLKLETYHQWWGLHWAGSLLYSYETSQESLIKKGAQDYGMQLAMRWIPGAIYSFAMINLMSFDPSKDAQLYLRSRQVSTLLGVGYLLNTNQEILLQALISESPYRDIGQLSRASYEIHVGYRHNWGDWGAELSLIENVIWPFNTPDWGINLSISYYLSSDSSQRLAHR
ncbi:DUF3187 family protein [Pseudobacteriovorax antillogorgiicola]|uniref:MetA-pathway of phenol degradation n=1 Tax=Pseudobacteriovorax antillogorgiicola TaxID=1513793 RepID=A0A1Y6CR82_9BACT|nr:DUF3187 family protein [Pseudobacteriovorax antillogorgiicola]TCS45889.1 uncharacterized protein DUF3187 [Pseudobacteriovorax antillogorgiicola]SMF71177.1 Protein of unknown function [Pseudobacteriovorax antillogorgiicola]